MAIRDTHLSSRFTCSSNDHHKGGAPAAVWLAIQTTHALPRTKSAPSEHQPTSHLLSRIYVRYLLFFYPPPLFTPLLRGRSRCLLHHRRRPPSLVRGDKERYEGRECVPPQAFRFIVSCFPFLSCAHDEVNAAVSGNHSAQPTDRKPKRGVFKRALMIEEDAKKKKIDVESFFFFVAKTRNQCHYNGHRSSGVHCDGAHTQGKWRIVCMRVDVYISSSMLGVEITR